MTMQFYTDEQVAAMLQVPTRTIAEFRRKGSIRSTKIGKYARISDADLTRYLNEISQCQESEKTQNTGSTELMDDTNSSGSSKQPANSSAQTSTSSGQKVVGLDDYQRGRLAAQRRRNSH